MLILAFCGRIVKPQSVFCRTAREGLLRLPYLTALLALSLTELSPKVTERALSALTLHRILRQPHQKDQTNFAPGFARGEMAVLRQDFAGWLARRL